MSYGDITAIPACLLCIELAVISILHLYAFSSKSYKPPLGRPGIRMFVTAVIDTLNPSDILEAMIRGRKWKAIPIQARR
ncbi:hypothetical protein D6C98_08690 [Aureobasidium pullulans]|nr:hypothetical protein D6D03_03692 [Aureobasidium pullulans]THY43075.1 hypothetical protein D6C98_08690 [Aureobasidium pullulans]THZ16762.1 hypothetical protein D6C89_09107 [Aureobasidium pullulans]